MSLRLGTCPAASFRTCEPPHFVHQLQSPESTRVWHKTLPPTLLSAMLSKSESRQGLVSESQAAAVAAAIAAGALAPTMNSSSSETTLTNSTYSNGAYERGEVQKPSAAPDDTGLLLLPKFSVKPTSSRFLVGLWDLLLLVLIALPFAILKAARYLLSWMGVNEHR